MFLGKKKISLNQDLQRALCSIFGIGKTRTHVLSRKFGCVRKTKLRKLHPKKRKFISNFINNKYCIDNLLMQKNNFILSLNLINGSYKGIRIRQGLPLNGQRTRSNAQTARKKLLFKYKKKLI